jgi:hypothetical protein
MTDPAILSRLDALLAELRELQQRSGVEIRRAVECVDQRYSEMLLSEIARQ